MAYYLLCTDLHLDDQEANEYRWHVIDRIVQATAQYDIATVFALGDAWDRKDRHSAALVNRTVEACKQITARAPLVILQGNHDRPMHEPAFWQFLNEIDGIHYITTPSMWGNGTLLLLPFTPTPKTDWAHLKLSQFQAIMMHATVTGAVVENGTVMTNDNFPILPRVAKIYSGDIHVPQQIRNITYVGAPHPIRYGDSYQGRMLLLNEAYDIALQIPLDGPKKLMLTISSIDELAQVQVRPGDQVKLRFNLGGDNIDGWGRTEAAIAQWARERSITIASTEVLVDSVRRDIDADQTPEKVLSDFAASERLSEDLLRIGLELLRETANA
jgi:hypothetical protein